MSTIIKIVAVLAIFIFIIWFRFSDNALRRNLRDTTGVVLLIAAVVLILFLSFNIFSSMKKSGEGLLLSNPGATSDIEETGGKTDEKDSAESPSLLQSVVEMAGTGNSVNDENADAPNETTGEIRIIVHLSEISVNGVKYDSVSEVEGILREAAGGGGKITLVDDYALASTYNELLELLRDMGVEAEKVIAEQ